MDKKCFRQIFRTRNAMNKGIASLIYSFASKKKKKKIKIAV